MSFPTVPQRYQVMVGDPASQYADEDEPGKTDRTTAFMQSYEWITPLFISYGGNGGIGLCQMRCHRAPEDAYGFFPLGVPVQVTDTYGAGTPIVFDGILIKKDYEINGTQTEFNLIAYCAGDDLLRRICLHGQVRLSHTREQNLWDEGVSGSPESISTTEGDDDIATVDTPLIFNVGGQPNMSTQTYYVDGDSTTTVNIFDVPFRNQQGPGGELKSDFWTLKAALKYLLTFHNTDWCLDTTQWNDDALDDFFDAYGDPVITNINLEAKPLLTALDMLLTPHNFIFYVDPRPNSSDHKQKLHLNFKGSGEDVKALSLSSKGTSAASSTANLISLKVTEDATPIVNNIIALGDEKIFTTLAHTAPSGNMLKLVKGWADSDLTWAFNDDSTVNTNDKDFVKNYAHPVGVTADGVAGVGRLWIVNQGEIQSSDLEDLTTKLADPPDASDNSINPRRFLKPEVFEANNAGGIIRKEHVTVEMSVDGGDVWGIVEKHWYEVLPDGMGIVFTSTELKKLGLRLPGSIQIGYWDALYTNTLQIRILMSVKSDARLRKEIPNTGSTIPLATARVYSNDGYRKLIYDSSIDSTVMDTSFSPVQTTVDDTLKLAAIAEQQAKLTDKAMIHGTAVVTFANIGDWVPGQTISGITGRGITYAPSKLPTVVKVVYDLVAQHCQLALDNHNTALIVQAKAVSDAETRREAKLGIGGLRAMQGHSGPLNYADETPAERKEGRFQGVSN